MRAAVHWRPRHPSPSFIYAAHNALAAVVAYAAGHWIDRVGPRPVFATGAVCYVAAYGLFAVPWHSWPPLLGAFLLAGSGIGFAETAESALLARMLPDALRGSGFGLLGAVQAAGDLASSAVVGVLWSIFTPAVGFAYAAAWMLASATTALGSRLRQPAEFGRTDDEGSRTGEDER